MRHRNTRSLASFVPFRDSMADPNRRAPVSKSLTTSFDSGSSSGTSSSSSAVKNSSAYSNTTSSSSATTTTVNKTSSSSSLRKGGDLQLGWQSSSSGGSALSSGIAEDLDTSAAATHRINISSVPGSAVGTPSAASSGYAFSSNYISSSSSSNSNSNSATTSGVGSSSSALSSQVALDSSPGRSSSSNTSMTIRRELRILHGTDAADEARREQLQKLQEQWLKTRSEQDDLMIELRRMMEERETFMARVSFDVR